MEPGDSPAAGLAAALARIVEDNGYVARMETDGVHFRAEGINYGLQVHDSDTEYARLILTYPLRPQTPIERAFEVANEMNLLLKAVKTVICESPRHVAFTIEVFFDDVEQFAPTFSRSLAALRHGSDEFFAALRAGDEPSEYPLG